MRAGFPLTHPGLLLRLEGGVALAAALVLYGGRGGGWLLFALLFLAPDLSALGYLAEPALGAACYNAAHTYLVPVVLGTGGLIAGQPLAVTLALIWGAHIGWDRLLGYGLKYTDAFGHTHLGIYQARRGVPASSRSASAGGAGEGMI